MSSEKLPAREEIIDSLIASIHKEARAITLFVHTVSDITGIHSTDIRCLDFLSEVRFATAGELANITGLTTGAVTAVIDRLERAGFVKREADSADRRKTIVRIVTGNSKNLELVSDLFTNQIPALLSGYQVNELKLITEWNLKKTATFHNEIKKLKVLKINTKKKNSKHS